MQLNERQKQQLFDEGYVHVPGVVPPVMVDHALSAINHNIGTKGLPPDQLKHFGYRSFCPDMTGDASITQLFNGTPARELLASAVGEGTVPEMPSGQIAIRFPRHTQKTPGPLRPHIDGFNEAADGVFRHFTALCGVVLSDTTHPDSGCFTVWPGSHHVAEKHFREHGMTRAFDFVPPLGDIKPVGLTAAPGDVIFTHYQLAHTAGANLSPHPRYAIFFRIAKEGHRRDDLSYYSDIWQEWDGMRDIRAAASESEAAGAVE